jgi:hypothetical protein
MAAPVGKLERAEEAVQSGPEQAGEEGMSCGQKLRCRPGQSEPKRVQIRELSPQDVVMARAADYEFSPNFSLWLWVRIYARLV